MPRPRTLITSTEMIRAFDIARLALEDRGFFKQISIDLQVSEAELAALYQTLMDFLEGDLRRESA